jgi:LysM domain
MRRRRNRKAFGLPRSATGMPCRPNSRSGLVLNRRARDRGAMSLGRLFGVLVLIAVLYAIFTQPLTSAAVARSGGSALASAGSSLTQFVSALTTGSTSTETAASTTGTTGSYTVRRGDTLSKIAGAHGTTAGTLAARNGLSNPNRITVGQRLSMG